MGKRINFIKEHTREFVGIPACAIIAGMPIGYTIHNDIKVSRVEGRMRRSIEEVSQRVIDISSNSTCTVDASPGTLSVALPNGQVVRVTSYSVSLDDTVDIDSPSITSAMITEESAFVRTARGVSTEHIVPSPYLSLERIETKLAADEEALSVSELAEDVIMGELEEC